MEWFEMLIEPLPTFVKALIAIIGTLAVGWLFLAIVIGIIGLVDCSAKCRSPKMWCYFGETRKRVKFPCNNESFYETMMNMGIGSVIEVAIRSDDMRRHAISLIRKLTSYPRFEVKVTQDVSLLSVGYSDAGFIVSKDDRDYWAIRCYSPKSERRSARYRYVITRNANESECEDLLQTDEWFCLITTALFSWVRFYLYFK